MRRFRSIAILFSLIFSFSAYAQTDIEINEYIGLDSFIFDSSLNFSIRTENVGDAIYTGDVEFFMSVGDSSLPNPINDSSGFSRVIRPDDIDTFSVTDLFLASQEFDGGVEIVVIWPVASDGTPLSSDSSDLSIKGRSGVSIKENSSQFKAYPMPARDIINIEGVEFDRVRIYGLNGRLVKTFNANSNQLDVSDLKAGKYISRLYKNNQQAAYFIFFKLE